MLSFTMTFAVFIANKTDAKSLNFETVIDYILAFITILFV